MPLEEIENEVEGFVRQHFKVALDDPRFNRDADLYEDGYIDSVGFAELMTFLESRFSIELQDGDIVSDDFSTVAGVSRIVKRLGEAEMGQQPGP
ncbi:MAG: acyl carrier protein [Chloroflexota bacterium]